MPVSLVGQSDHFRALHETLTRIASSDSKVLITGEPGTGKRIVAQAIHAAGPHSEMPLLQVGCSQISRAELESVLFDGGNGPFVDDQNHPVATVVLADVDALSLELQAFLLRFIEVGAPNNRSRRQVRLISTTSADLPGLIAQGLFREDLYYRLNVVHLHLQPLRERLDDVLVLFSHFWKLYQARMVQPPTPGLSLGSGVPEALWNYHWPGNVRELEVVARRLSQLGKPVELVDLMPLLGGQDPETPGGHEASSEFEITFSEEFSPDEIKNLLTATANYFRACGGAGFEVTFEAEEVRVQEPVGV